LYSILKILLEKNHWPTKFLSFITPDAKRLSNPPRPYKRHLLKIFTQRLAKHIRQKLQVFQVFALFSITLETEKLESSPEPCNLSLNTSVKIKTQCHCLVYYFVIAFRVIINRINLLMRAHLAWPKITSADSYINLAQGNMYKSMLTYHINKKRIKLLMRTHLDRPLKLLQLFSTLTQRKEVRTKVGNQRLTILMLTYNCSLKTRPLKLPQLFSTLTQHKEVCTKVGNQRLIIFMLTYQWLTKIRNVVIYCNLTKFITLKVPCIAYVYLRAELQTNKFTCKH
jgi:hypothetical protein